MENDIHSLVLSTDINIHLIKVRFGIYKRHVVESCMEEVHHLIFKSTENYKLEGINNSFPSTSGYMCRTISKGDRHRIVCFIDKEVFKSRIFRYPSDYLVSADIAIEVKWI